MFIENSRDILNIVISAAIGLLTIFICWGLYYFVQILRNGFKIVQEMRARLAKIDEAVKAFKDKIERSTSHLVLIAEGMKKLVEVIKEKTGKRD